MSKPRFRWWSYVRHVVRDYKKLSAAEHLTVDDRKDRDAVAKAISIAKQSPKGAEMLALIECIYWGSSGRRIEDAALRLYIGERTARRRHGDFIRLVAQCLGFSVAEDKQTDRENEPIDN